MHLERNKCSPLKFVSLTRSGSDVPNLSHSPAITPHLLFERICQETGVPFRVPLRVGNGRGKEEHPYWAALCELL